MDTKLKNSKFKPIIKTIILILTLIFTFQSGICLVQLIRKTIYFNEECNDLRNTPAFLINVENDLTSISYYAYYLNEYGQNMTFEEYAEKSTYAANLKQEYEEKLDKALTLYREIQNLKKNEPEQDGTYYDEEYNLFYDINGNEYAYFEDFEYALEEQKSQNTSNEFTNLYAKPVVPSAPEVSQEITTFIYETTEPTTNNLPKTYYSHAEWEWEYNSLRNQIFSIVSDARSEETIKTELENQLNNDLTNGYEDEKWNFHEIRNRYSNIDFFIQNKTTGNYISNFEKAADIDNLKENYKTDALYYFYYNGKSVISTPIKLTLKNAANSLLFNDFYFTDNDINFDFITQNFDYLTENFEDCTVYIKINYPEKSTDDYFSLNQAFEANKYLLATELKIQTTICCILSLAGVVALAILTKPKYKDGNLNLSLKQRTLFLIHLILYLAIVFFIGSVIVIAFCEEYTSSWTFLSNDFSFLITDKTLKIFVGTLLSLLVLFTINFINYIVVNKKADTLKERFICYKIRSNCKRVVEKNKELGKTVKQIETKFILVIAGWSAFELLLLFLIITLYFSGLEGGALFLIFPFIGTAVLGILFILKFLGQIKTLALAVEDMKNGNLNINLTPENFVFPLKDFAKNLNDCRDSIENAVNEALKGERLKTELITNVSHDLKTPLTSIINYISLLKLCEIKGEDENKYLDILDEKSKKLQRLIEDLTEASKASSGNIKMTFDTVNLNELALQSVGENNDVLENAGLDIVFSQKDSALFVKADSQHTFRIFDNLFSNVKKYALPGTRVYVDVLKEGNYGVFTIKNISKEKLNISASEITERFVRGDNSRTSEGSGLGLSIARSFTELQNGIFLIEIDGDLFKVSVKLPITNKQNITNEFGIAKENKLN